MQIDTIVSHDLAEAIMAEIGRLYFTDWSLIVYATDVDVLRGEKYGSPPT